MTATRLKHVGIGPCSPLCSRAVNIWNLRRPVAGLLGQNVVSFLTDKGFWVLSSLLSSLLDFAFYNVQNVF